ncbi:MAG: type IX secretion system sortase PorU [Bacteroidetes bacterium]|nr:type IX secretion system sortase PorU [Bacteroidota bacterium]
MLKTLFYLLLFLVPSGLLTAQNFRYADIRPDLPKLFKLRDAGDKSVWTLSNPRLMVSPSGEIIYVGSESDPSDEVIPERGSFVSFSISDPGTRPQAVTVTSEPDFRFWKRRQIGVFSGNDVLICTKFTLSGTGKRQPESSRIAFQKTTAAESLFESGLWVRLKPLRSGIFKLTASDLISFGFSKTENPKNLRVFSSSGPRPSGPGTVEIPLFSETTEPDVWSDSQVWYFYSDIQQGIYFDSTSRAFSWYDDIYSENQYLFLGFGTSPGKRMESVPGTLIEGVSETGTAQFMVWENPESENLLKSGTLWVGPRISANSTQIWTQKLPDYVTGSPVLFRGSVLAQYPSTSLARLSILESGQYVVKDIITGYSNPANYEDKVARERTVSGQISKLNQDRASIEIALVSNGTATGWLDWFTLQYSRSLLASKTEIDFFQPSSGGPVNFRIGGFRDSGILVFNLDNPLSPKVVSQTSISGGDIRFGSILSPEKANRFFAVHKTDGVISAGSLSWERLGVSTVPDAFAAGIDYVIITPPQFTLPAKRLLAHRVAQNWNGAVVTTEDIYTHFSGGKANPEAIRKFIGQVYSAGSGVLKNVLLLGDASYDFKEIGGKKSFPGLIPTFESQESLLQRSTFCSDDDFSRVTSDGQFRVGIGRLPVVTVAEADQMVDKLINYDLNSEKGDWRMKVTMVADDGLTSSGDDYDLHTYNAEVVSTLIPPYLSVRKLYSVSFPTITTSEGRRKPEAANSLINYFNSGSVVINYSGHGNTKVWTHERILEIGAFLPRLTNSSKLPFLITATCDFGKYDDPDEQSAAELLVTQKETGVIGMFTTTRLVYTDRRLDGPYNLALNYYLFSNLFKKNDTGKNLSLGEVYTLTKQHFSELDVKTGKFYTDENVNKFSLLADPATRLLIPEGRGRLLNKEAELTQDSLIQFQIQSVGRLSGRLSELPAGNADQFSGSALIRLAGEPVTVTVPEWVSKPGTDVTEYQNEGSDIFKGLVSVSDGQFSMKFMVPSDVTPSRSPARVSGFLWNEKDAGLILSPRIQYISGGTGALTDTLPPSVSLFINDSSFSDGQRVANSGFLKAVISDSSGINTTGLGIGHQLLGILDNDLTGAIDMSPYFTANLNDFTTGTIEYPLSTVSAGPHEFKLKVWDSFNNGAESTIRFVVTEGTDFSVSNLYPYPNPFGKTVRFFYNQNLPDAKVQITASIYTLNGLLIRTLKQHPTETNNGGLLVWDGLDSDGDPVANGIYLARLVLKETGSGKTKTEIIKLMKYN